MTAPRETFDAVVVGGGPAGSTAANDLAMSGRSVLLLDRAGRIKPCGGAIQPRLIREFAIPDELLVARIASARMISPSDRRVEMPINGGFVGMVDREIFDAWLRGRAADAGAERRTGVFEDLTRDADGTAVVHYRIAEATGGCRRAAVRTRAVIGADGANSAVARAAIPATKHPPFVFAYHEFVRSPALDTAPAFDATRCDIYYRGSLSPDFYAWVFPHGATTSVGTGTAHKGFSLRAAVEAVRAAAGLATAATLRCEGAPIPLRPRRQWDNGRDVVLAGDAAGAVAPASGEGIYYAMASGRLAAEAVGTLLATGDGRVLASARKRFMQAHGRVFWVRASNPSFIPPAR
ncbi:MAG TPA: geranylgeranyl diphosphate reductase [Rhodospirillales bacterium]|nr:geranylgeranyl diphosphate reductase [Rhodospirillales bacterium]